MPCPQSYHFEPLFPFLNAPSIDRTFGNLTQICHGMLLGNTLEVVCFFFLTGGVLLAHLHLSDV